MRKNEFIDLAFGLKYLFNGHHLCLPGVITEIPKRCFLMQTFKRFALKNVKIDGPAAFTY
ncbi:MAG: hypothetical protein JWQ84_1604 [Mucilaginibacter sp.]|jgi:hypothetical protein|nr:hypothetical protein [Mucilaginibacter sp.]MDB5016772.1 hypothetical protein [Mucilaginibacter sp.]MDB5140324.1 hypothetical protein [Mucilaginibacter sp.]